LFTPEDGLPVALDSLTLRTCHTVGEFRQALALQKEVWGFADAELVPVRLFVVGEKVGGHVIGAYEGSEMVAFAYAIPGLRNGRSYLHSHMLAVREQYRNAGLGRRIKLFQRELALEQGVELIEWTFDPLEIKNSFFNLERLGAIARRYVVNQYGITSSPLQGGLPTDRLVAEWWLRSRRVEAVLKTGQPPPAVADARVEVPAEIYQWKAAPEQRARAAEVQGRNRDLLQAHFSGGRCVLGYERDAKGNGTFVIGRWDEDLQL